MTFFSFTFLGLRPEPRQGDTTPTICENCIKDQTARDIILRETMKKKRKMKKRE